MQQSGSCTNKYSYLFDGEDGMLKMQDVMRMFRYGFKTIGGLKVESVKEKSPEAGGNNDCSAVEYRLAGGSYVMIQTSGTEPELEVCIYAAGNSKDIAADTEARIRRDLESIIYMDHGMGYCCE